MILWYIMVGIKLSPRTFPRGELLQALRGGADARKKRLPRPAALLPETRLGTATTRTPTGRSLRAADARKRWRVISGNDSGWVDETTADGYGNA